MPSQREALADFLRTRRERLSPVDVGLPGGGRRRTPGLRREEVAILANVGISWYTALEQGRDVQPSEAILNSLADALRLNIDERLHLFWLAGQHLTVMPSQVIDDHEVNPALQQILNALDPNPAYILNLHWNYMAWNESADRIFSITTSEGPYGNNLVWQLFMNPQKRRLYIQWEAVAQNVVAEFRAEVEKYPCKYWICQFLADLRAASPEFEQLWEKHDVQRNIIRRKELHHDQFGYLCFDHTPLVLAEHPTLKMIVYTGSTSPMG